MTQTFLRTATEVERSIQCQQTMKPMWTTLNRTFPLLRGWNIRAHKICVNTSECLILRQNGGNYTARISGGFAALLIRQKWIHVKCWSFIAVYRARNTIEKFTTKQNTKRIVSATWYTKNSGINWDLQTLDSENRLRSQNGFWQFLVRLRCRILHVPFYRKQFLASWKNGSEWASNLEQKSRRGSYKGRPGWFRHTYRYVSQNRFFLLLFLGSVKTMCSLTKNK